MSGSNSAQLATPPHESGRITVVPLNAFTRSLDAKAAAAAAGSLAGPSDAAVCTSQDQLPCFVLLDDAWRATSHLQDMFESMARPLYSVSLPQVCKIFVSF